MIFSICLLCFCVILFVNTLQLKPSLYEPLGPAFFPQVILGFTICCVLILLYQTINHKKDSSDQKTTTSDFVSRPWLAVGSFFITAVYVFVMQMELISYPWATFVYLITLTGIMSRIQVRSILTMTIIALVFSGGCFYLFTQVFAVDLP